MLPVPRRRRSPARVKMTSTLPSGSWKKVVMGTPRAVARRCNVATLGELSPRYPGSHDLRQLAYPYPDWYEVDWAECVNP